MGCASGFRSVNICFFKNDNQNVYVQNISHSTRSKDHPIFFFLYYERDEITAGFLMRQSTVAGTEVAGLMFRVRRDTVDATSP